MTCARVITRHRFRCHCVYDSSIDRGIAEMRNFSLTPSHPYLSLRNKYCTFKRRCKEEFAVVLEEYPQPVKRTFRHIIAKKIRILSILSLHMHATRDAIGIALPTMVMCIVSEPRTATNPAISCNVYANIIVAAHDPISIYFPDKHLSSRTHLRGRKLDRENRRSASAIPSTK